MNLWNKIKAFFPSKGGGMVFSSWANPSERNLQGYLSAYGEVYSLFGIALRIATAVGEVKWRLYKGSERSERNQISEHPILKLLDYANEFQTGQEVIELTQLMLDLSGKAYWYLPRNGLGAPAEVWVLPPHQVKIVKDNNQFISGYIYIQGGQNIPLSRNTVIPFSMPDPLNPYGGIGFVQPASVEIDSEIYAGRWNRNFFYNSARPDGVLETDDSLTKEQKDDLREAWKEGHGGLAQAHKIAVLEGGLKYKQIQVTQKDMDFALLRKQTRENLLFTFGMPLSVMGISENVNRANAEAGDYTFARWLIKPRLTRIKNKLNEQLLPMYPKAKGIEIDFDEVVPETIEQKQTLAESGVRSGWMTVNEARKLNGFDPIPSGDMLLIPLNLIPTSVSGKITTAPQPVVEESKSLSEEHKETIWRIYAQKTERIEGQFIKILRDLWQNQESEVTGNLLKNRSDIVLFNEAQNNDEFKYKLLPVVQLAYEEGIEGTKQERFLDPDAVEWLNNRSLLMAKGINETTLKMLRRTLTEGFSLGESIPKLAARVRVVYEEADKVRSLMIARTEVITASAKGAEDNYRKLGVQKLEWFVAQDERTCGECMALNGNIYAITEGPRPALHPNCRCVMLPVTE